MAAAMALAISRAHKQCSAACTWRRVALGAPGDTSYACMESGAVHRCMEYCIEAFESEGCRVCRFTGNVVDGAIMVAGYESSAFGRLGKKTRDRAFGRGACDGDGFEAPSDAEEEEGGGGILSGEEDEAEEEEEEELGARGSAHAELDAEEAVAHSRPPRLRCAPVAPRAKRARVATHRYPARSGPRSRVFTFAEAKVVARARFMHVMASPAREAYNEFLRASVRNRPVFRSILRNPRIPLMRKLNGLRVMLTTSVPQIFAAPAETAAACARFESLFAPFICAVAKAVPGVLLSDGADAVLHMLSGRASGSGLCNSHGVRLLPEDPYVAAYLPSDGHIRSRLAVNTKRRTKVADILRRGVEVREAAVTMAMAGVVPYVPQSG